MKHPLLPRLYYDHPGYFKVGMGLLVAHLLLGVDALLGGGARHPWVAWQFIYQLVLGHLAVWAVMHFLVCALGIAGLYLPERYFWLAKAAWGLSFVEFNILALCFAAAFFLNGASMFPVIVCLSSSISSFAALNENRFNPLMNKLRSPLP